ncbi:cation diffusion facilitator family transporter [Halobacillus shinanisalinarum]|uniref:Cation diffusion facilitator family transporter n=1 Tax=Halobacillus shinanisalinarum TaxID=2932258 RepID=A0ABY4H1H1_9BACI|nr:cation diffusion facilitator family transporter [Halobacillus shinanisalinarum]UOQ94189.1 cation diffusion facilitator family transporter [Halobacillus shinanisalinarum]
MAFLKLLKKGNKSSGIAALGNTLLAIIKAIAAAVSGSGAMFATAIHSAADATNQGFVYFGSALAEKEPTERFPTGFGRVVNLFVLVAVTIITIMAYETILKGWGLIQDPHPSSNIWLNIGVLIIAIIIDGYILIKVMKEIVVESRTNSEKGNIFINAFKNVSLAAPPTRLVFYEDIIATAGSAIALIFVVLSNLTGLYFLDGLGTLIIGILLIGIALKIGYENTIGLIGVAAPKIVEERIAKIILGDQNVVDISKLRTLQEGRDYHVESYIELKEGLTLGEADDIKYQVQEKVMEDPGVVDVTIGILETDDQKDWQVDKSNPKKN